MNLLWIIWINENDSGTEFRSFDGISLGSDVNLGSVFQSKWFALGSEIFKIHSSDNEDIFLEITLSQSFVAFSLNDVDSEKLHHSHFPNQSLPN